MITKIIWNKEYGLTISNDDFASDPRENDNLGTMLYNHWRYDLWDEKLEELWESFWNDFMNYVNDKYIRSEASEYNEFFERWIQRYIDNNIVYFPLSLYDHSWLSISMWYSKWFDSGQIGYIYAHKDKIREDQMVTLVNDKIKRNVEKIFQWEIDSYNKYLNGEYLQFIIEEREIKEIDWKEFKTEWEHYDSGSWFETLEEMDIDKDIFTEEEILNYFN